MIEGLPVDSGRLVSYMVAMTIVAATPGPAILFSIAMGVDKGPKAVLASAVGMNTATLVWYCASALGLGALIATFPEAFRYLTILSAAYLAWLGVSAIDAAMRARSEGPKVSLRQSGANPFMSGFLVQIANPKVLLFFAAVLPPFLVPEKPLIPQLLIFAAVSVAADMTAMVGYGMGGAAISARLSKSGPSKWFGLFVGTVLIFAAVVILMREF